MIPGNIKTTTGNIPFDLPTDWKELTLAQVIALNKDGLTDTETLAILTGLELEIWLDVPEVFKQIWLAKLAPLLLTEPVDWFSLPLERTVLLGEQEITFPESSASAPAGANEALRDEIELMSKQEKPDYMKLIPVTLALYAVKPMFGKYGLDGYENSKQLLPLINALPAAQALPLGNFFLKISEKRPKNGVGSLGINLIRKKLMQAYRSLASSEASPPSKPLRAVG